MKYIKKPIPVEAIQWQVNLESEQALRDFGCIFEVQPNPDFLVIETLEGLMTVQPWAYVVKGPFHEYWPVKCNIFEQTYEKVE